MRIITEEERKEEFQYCLESAEAGDIHAQYALGRSYENGIGTTVDYEKSFYWYQKSAEGGNSAGQYNVGYCYQNGIGTTQNEEKAFEWYMKSAENGNTVGQHNVGYCYEFGIGTSKCEEKAFYWYFKSAENGSKWIPYSQFKQIEYLAHGGFGKIFKAIWVRRSGDIKVALKSLNDSGNVTIEFLKEFILHKTMNNEGLVLNCLGITKDSSTNTYMMIMEYAEDGSLHQYLSDHFEKITWKEKLEKLCHVAAGLENIHKRSLVHCDIHSGNILLGVSGISGSIRIADLGLCQVRSTSTPENVYGVIPYLAPEILAKSPFTQESDVYSFGMLMWEFTSGHRPFENKSHDYFLRKDIIDGLRPEITEDTPSAFANLIKRCWNHNPSDRPSMSDIKNQFDKWVKEKECEEEFIFAEECRKGLLEKRKSHGRDTHPEAYYTSRLLNPMIKESSEVVNAYDSAQSNLKLSDIVISPYEQ